MLVIRCRVSEKRWVAQDESNSENQEGIMKTLIDIKNMYKIYEMGSEKVHALDGIDIAIHEKEFVAIIGPSGSGKSTLMNMIGCLDSPTSGEYYIEGINIAKYSETELAHMRNAKIGFIFQQFNLFRRLSALENVEMPAKYMRVPRQERREKALKALDLVGLSDRVHHRPTELSGGQQQRVAIARSLVNDPPIILADEPTGNLDSKSGKDIMNMIKSLHEQGNTVILITHDVDIATKADRVIHLKDGKITSDIKRGES
jgi:putative ABC transport system ATP-binding protein